MTPIHTHHQPQLELQAIGGAIRLGRKGEELGAMGQAAIAGQILDSMQSA